MLAYTVILQKLYKILLYFPITYVARSVVQWLKHSPFKLGFNFPSGYKVGCPGHSNYMWVGQYEPSCLQFPSSVLEDKLW